MDEWQSPEGKKNVIKHLVWILELLYRYNVKEHNLQTMFIQSA